MPSSTIRSISDSGFMSRRPMWRARRRPLSLESGLVAGGRISGRRRQATTCFPPPGSASRRALQRPRCRSRSSSSLALPTVHPDLADPSVAGRVLADRPGSGVDPRFVVMPVPLVETFSRFRSSILVRSTSSPRPRSFLRAGRSHVVGGWHFDLIDRPTGASRSPGCPRLRTRV